MKPEHLKSLCDAATPGPWEWKPSEVGPQLEGNIKHGDMSPILVAAGCNNDKHTSEGVRGCLAWDVNKDDPMRACPLHPTKDDRCLITSSVNTLPALLKLWEAVADYQTWYRNEPITGSDRHSERQAANAIQSALSELEAI